MRTFAILFVAIMTAVGWNAAAAEDALQGALLLKKSAVARTWENCIERGASEKRCKSLLKAIHDRELKVINELSQYLYHPDINEKRMSTEMSACYFSDYNELVSCQARLLDRIKAALSGETLLKK